MTSTKISSKNNTSARIKSINKPLKGEIEVIGDKSVSFRSIFFAVMLKGDSKISGINYGSDITQCINALRNLGITISKISRDTIKIIGNNANFIAPTKPLDIGSSATCLRILMSMLVTKKFKTTFIGSSSLSRRSMKRIIDILKNFGCEIIAPTNSLPITISGGIVNPFEIKLEAPSAQIQTALIMLALKSKKICKITYSAFIRDHTEKMLKAIGFDFSLKNNEDNTKTISIKEQNHLTGVNYKIYGDPSMAAYFVVAALIIPESDLIIKNIYVQKNRTGYIDILKKMGGDIELENKRIINNEEVADIKVRYSKLKGINIPAYLSPTMIDEYPILSVAASFASGSTIMNGLNELKAKESNRILSISQALGKLGIHFNIDYDSLEIIGNDNDFIKYDDVIINCFQDHRIVMSFIIFALASKGTIVMNNISYIKCTFPNFIDILKNLGADIEICNKFSLDLTNY